MTLEIPKLRLCFLDAMRKCEIEPSEYYMHGPSGRLCKGRDSAFSHFRAAFIHYARKHYQPQPSLPEIARVLGLTSHSAVVVMANNPLTPMAEGMLAKMREGETQ